MLRSLRKPTVVQTDEFSTTTATATVNATVNATEGMTSTVESLQLQNAQLMSEVERLKAKKGKPVSYRSIARAPGFSFKNVVRRGKLQLPTEDITERETNTIISAVDKKKGRLARIVKRKSIRKFQSFDAVENQTVMKPIHYANASSDGLEKMYIPPEIHTEPAVNEQVIGVCTTSNGEMSPVSQSPEKRLWNLYG